ncbi:MG2 domain-containing protein [Fibrella forsythiae]|uniref:TonB-dependent receptor plug domain-containing protein n=1 Tax=Fibrella forsythiae TaxID=2817061 RepID=A0ABS3JED9_9BACT|nr:MG2 domain-containing protein [Fibrella forsythiae]MBO0948370.1 TonB-dependent receptor plug domain-containing protein [Fibrella forsythiae]
MSQQPLSKALLFTILLSVVTLLVAVRSLFSDPLDQVLARIRAYEQQYPYEKVYVHTDRTTYLPGETIWMKSYLFYGASRGADSSSGAVLVDLVSPNGQKIRLDTRFQTKGGYGEGYLPLPDSMETGRYTLRAYTGWMRNFSEDWYFTKAIDIVRANDPKGATTAGNGSSIEARPDVQFLPEGGQLVAGLTSRVAFKAVSPAGVGVDVSGFVLDSRKDTIVGFQSQHLGMGTFPLIPEAGQTYQAFVKIPGTTGYTSYTMPAPQPAGYLVQVDNLSNKDNIRVFVSNSMPPVAATPESGSAAAMLTVLAQVNGQPILALRGPASRKQFVVQIPRAKCPEGIVQITLLDPAGKPVSERLVYSAQDELINLAVTPATPVAGPRQRVDLTVTATNAAGKPVMADLSLAVTDLAQQPKRKPFAASLPSYLLLTSDLTGYVEQPGYYFDQTNKDRLANLDLLLMTQGWRRITWDKVLVDSLPPTRYPFDPGLTVSGTVYRGTSKNPAPGIPLTIMVHRKDSTQDLYSLSADEKGRFFLSNANLIDTATVFVQAQKTNGSRNFTITIDKLVTPQIRVVRPPLVPSDIAYAELAEFLKRQSEYAAIEAQIRRNREVQLQTVVVKAKRVDPYATQRGIFSNADVSLKVDEMNSAGALTIFDILRSRVAGVQVSGGGLEPTVQIRGAANFSGVIEPMFMIDGMAVDKSAISSIMPSDVAYIDVIKGASAALLGSRGAGGGINVIMKRGGETNDYVNKVVPGVRVEKMVGFAPKRTFYAPRYDKPTPEEKVRPDYRATLLWAPRIQTDAAGKATVSFYTSDAKTSLHLVLEGATVSGQPGHAEATMKVE